MITLGADPEFFIFDKRVKRYVPAHLFFRGKEDKHGHPRGRLFRDGFALELNPNPSPCRQTLSLSVQGLMQYAQEMLPAYCELRAVPVAMLTAGNKRQLRSAPPDVQMFGCDPSLNAYSTEPCSVSLDGMRHGYRYAGGHMHFSGEIAGQPKAHRTLAKLFDLFLGVPLTYISSGGLTALRRRYYGRAGEFRTQRYHKNRVGFEYRTPGPELWRSAELASFAFGVGREIIRNYAKYKAMYEQLAIPPRLIIHAINSGHVPDSLLQRLRVPFFYDAHALRFIRQHTPYTPTIPFMRQGMETILGGYGGWLTSQRHYSALGASSRETIFGNNNDNL